MTLERSSHIHFHKDGIVIGFTGIWSVVLMRSVWGCR